MSIGIALGTFLGDAGFAPASTDLLLDQFSSAINPIVDAAAVPGPGTRDITGTLWYAEDGALRGGGQTSSPTWGNSKIVYTVGGSGIARQDGRVLIMRAVVEDQNSELGVGWATTTAVTNANTDGHHLVINGYFDIGTPGKATRLSGTGGTTLTTFRPVEVAVIIVLRAQGAFYLVSTFAPYTKAGSGTRSIERIGIPQWPDARVLWVDDVDTTATLYPHIGALDSLNYPNKHYIDGFRVRDVSAWATDAGIASGVERFAGADSNTTLGTGWTADLGTWGVSSNKGYVVTSAGTANRAYKTLAASGDGIWACTLVAPTTVTDKVGFIIRRVDANNYIAVHNNGASTLRVQVVSGGVLGSTITSNSVTWVAGQTYRIKVITAGAYYQLYLDGTILGDWAQDAGNNHLTGTGIGPYAGNAATGARWDDFMVVPNTVTLPATLQSIDEPPRILTAGSTIAADTFTAANGTAISGRTPDTGNAWAVAKLGAGTGAWTIQSNQASNSDIGDDTSPEEYFAVIDCGAADVEATVTITSPAVDSVIRCGLTLRYTDNSNRIAVRLFMDPGQAGSDEIEIIEVVSGSGSVVKKYNNGNYYGLSTAYTLKAQILGSVLHVFLDGEPVLTYIPRLTSGTKHGLYHSANDDGSTFDGFTVKAIS